MNTQLFPISLAHLRESAQPWVTMLDRAVASPTRLNTEPEPARISLARNTVLGFQKGDFNHSLQVQRGIIWLTATPGTQDHVLTTGDVFAVHDNFPIVIQALEDSMVTLA